MDVHSHSADPICVARVVLGYDGADFHGWQVQPGLRTVQGSLIQALERIVPLASIPPGAGRTDAGVHATGQVTTIQLAHDDLVRRVAEALPRMVPDDVVLHAVSREPLSFHARFSARGRHYSYRILTRKDPMRRRDHLLHPGPLDFDAMRESLTALRGDLDCSSFCRVASLEEGKTRCVIRAASLGPAGDDAWVFRISADRFLHSMVRTVVGTLLEIGRGRRPADDFVRILKAKDRAAAGATAPAHGLTLEHVDYDGERGENLMPRAASTPCDA